MEWSENGIVLGHKKHGESSLILEVMTRQRGRHLGLVRGGRSRRMAALLQVGNTLSLTWRARLDEHLGLFQLDGDTLRGAQLMDEPIALLAAQVAAAHLRLLPERDPHPRLYDLLDLLLGLYGSAQASCALVARLELALLEDLGFGLDLSRCAATGVTDNLVYVSPKSGRAVCAAAGEPYKDRLLPMPALLYGSVEKAGKHDLSAALHLTGYFLQRDVWTPRGIRPLEAREALINRLKRMVDDEGSPVEPSLKPTDAFATHKG